MTSMYLLSVLNYSVLCTGLGSIPFGIGIDQFSSAPIQELEVNKRNWN